MNKYSHTCNSYTHVYMCIFIHHLKKIFDIQITLPKRIYKYSICIYTYIDYIHSVCIYTHTIYIYTCIYIYIGASLVAQWLRVCLLMQGTRVRALVWEDPTCRGATRPVSHNYWACASGACAPQQERTR